MSDFNPADRGQPGADGPSVRAEVERVVATGHFSHRAVMLLALAGQLTVRSRSRGLAARDVAAATLAVVQVAAEAAGFRRGRPSPRWVARTSLVTGVFIHHLGRHGGHPGPETAWEAEWLLWVPISVRMADRDADRRWAGLAALPLLADLIKPTGTMTRARSGRTLLMLACAEVFGEAFGKTLRNHGDAVDALAAHLVSERAEVEAEVAREQLRHDAVASSIDRLRLVSAQRGDAPPAAVHARVQREFEYLRQMILQAGNSDMVAGEPAGAATAQTQLELERLSEQTRDTLTSMGRLIPLPVAAIVISALVLSPPRRRRWMVVPLVGAHMLRVLTHARREQSALRATGSRSVLVNLDLALGAVAYHLVDLATGDDGDDYVKWAHVSVCSLAFSAAESARSEWAALLPAATYLAARLTTRTWVHRDRTAAIELAGTTAYLAFPAWALARIFDGAWEAEARLTEWAVAAAELATTQRVEAERRTVQVALHDHGVQTLRYLARHPDLPPERRREVLEQAVAELEEVSGNVRPRQPGLEAAIRECADGYGRFGLHATVELELDDATAASDEAAAVLLDAMNQGLANVLAHTADRCPTVRVEGNHAELMVAIANATATPFHGGPMGFGLTQLQQRIAGVGGDLRWGGHPTMTELFVTVPRAVPA